MPVAEMVKDLAAHHGPMETVACVRPCEFFWADQGHRVGHFNTYLLNLIESVLEPNNPFSVSLIYKINTLDTMHNLRKTLVRPFAFSRI